MTGRWLSRAPEDTDPQARVRLFCFPHAGGGSSLFLPWRDALAPEIEVCPVVLPGREARIREEPYDRLTDLLDPLVEAILPYLDRDFALFGHSMGSVVAYELARRLEHEHASISRCLFISGRRAPHLPTRREPLHRLPEPEFLQGLRKLNGTPTEVLGDQHLIDLFLPTLRADFAVNETYEPLSGQRLSCPVGALTGSADPEVNLDEIAQWRDVSTGDFSLRVFQGDHFYLKREPDEVLAAIRRDLVSLECPVVAQTLN